MTARMSPTRQRVQREENLVGFGISPRFARLQIVVVDVPKTSAKVLSSTCASFGRSSNEVRCAMLFSLLKGDAPE